MKKTTLLLAIATAQILSSCATTNEPPTLTVEQKKADVYYNQGTSDLVEKNYLPALTNLLKAKELDPKNSKIRNNLGMAYYFRDQFQLAENELKEAARLDRENVDANMNLGSLYMGRNRLKEARAQFEIVEKNLTFSGQYRNYYNLAILEMKEGDRKAAFDYLAKSINEKPDYCSAHFMLGELYTEEFRYKEALSSFREAGKGTCVSEPAPVYHQGLTLLSLNRTNEAKMKFTEVQEKHSKSRYSTLAGVQLKKINNSSDEQSEARSTQTERIRSTDESVETPNF